MFFVFRFLVFVLLLCPNLCSQNSFGQTNFEFSAPRAFDGGSNFAIGDFTGDSKLDIVSVHSNNIKLRSGNGDGRFASEASVIFTCTGFIPSTAFGRPISAELNGDGKLDFVVMMTERSCVQRSNRVLAVFLGNGNGSFAPPIFTEVLNSFFIPDQFESSDLNDDGFSDFLVASAFNVSDGDKVGIFLSNGSGGFAEPVVYNLGGQAFFSLKVGDFTNDSRPDLLFARRTQGDLILLVNNGVGGFSAPQTVATFFVFNAVIATGDFNGDGNLDVGVIRDDGPRSFQVWHGNGNGTLTLGPSVTLPNFGSATIYQLIRADLTSDLRLDVAVCLAGRIFILKGLGNSTFAWDQLYGVGTGLSYPADFNNDGRTDIVTTQTLAQQGTANGTSEEFAVLLGLTNGRLLTAPGLELPWGGEEVAIADLTNDGLEDLALTGDSLHGEFLVLIQTAGKTATESQVEVSTSPQSLGTFLAPRTIATSDFDRDGRIDIVVAGTADSGSSENVTVARNNGMGDFSRLTSMSLGGTVTKVIGEDLNGDSIPDLAFSQARSFSTPPVVPGLVVALGIGDGTFHPPVDYLQNVTSNGIVGSDLNGDSRCDLALLTGTSISVFINNGLGGFSASASYSLQSAGSDIELADMNADGVLDILVATDLARVSVFNGIGNGTFSNANHYPTGGRPYQELTVADFNGDGKPDVASSNNGVVIILKNGGLGQLGEKSTWITTGGLRGITSADINSDGKPDIITSSHVQNFFSLGLMFNLTDFTQPSSPFDFDGDGKTDVGIFRPSVGEWWYQRSSDLQVRVGQFGTATDRTVPGDYTGDGKTDVAFWRPSSGEWFVLRSEDSTFFAFPFGTNGDVPVPADYDADGRADAAVFRPGSATWFISNSGGSGTSILTFGISTDKPVVADYDGDAKADIAIWRAGPGEWWVRRSTNGSIFAVQFGTTSDRPVQGDYTGDGKADIAFWRPADGNWFVVRSEDSSFFSFPFGSNGDVPVPGDYDGDGRQDAAVWRPSSATWFLNRSTAGIAIQQFGLPTDTPIPSAFVP